ncbi:cyclic nucleotide-binding domain-containing protein 2 [Pseudophryne corroboree]|uniref:cyclic nucleotide-binding domain-containing protein 2 n=1 Tax=Pseudophryne corroboree TaxID=495146 RepID=UPI0030818C24
MKGMENCATTLDPQHVGLEDGISREEGLEEKSPSVTPERQRKTLQRLAEEIRIMCRVCKIFRQRLRGFPGCQLVATDSVISVEGEEDSGKTSFDHTLFRTRKNHFPRNAEFITRKNPARRTEAETRLLCSLLQVIPSYQHYSNHLQMLLARVFRFQRFGRRRVIIRKGHVGDSFYFIYSGCVAITNDEDGSSTYLDQEPVLLHAGAKFGDIALLKGHRRNATVVCMKESEFLVVDKEDFFANKLDAELQKEFQYRYKYFRSLDVISHWPSEHIESISGRCQIRPYHFDQLVQRDSSESNSIAFVTEGTCEVLRLVKVTHCPSYHKWLRASLPLPKSPPTLKTTTNERSLADRKALQGRLASLKEEAAHLCARKKRDIREKAAPEGPCSAAAAAVYVRIDVLQENEFFGLQEALLPYSQRDTRRLLLLSKNCKILFLKKMKFDEFCDGKTLQNLQQYQKSYPSDDDLCKHFLQQNDWNMYKKDLVTLLLKPLSTNRYVKKKKHALALASCSPTGVLDLRPVSIRNTSPSGSPRGIYVSAQNRTVRLIHAITVPRPQLRGLVL